MERTFNLQQILGVQVAAKLWEQKDRTLLEDIFAGHTYNQVLYDERFKKVWCDFMCHHVCALKSEVELPKSILNHFTRLLLNVGNEIFTWRSYLKYMAAEFHSTLDPMSKICWTPHGTVDQIATFRQYWLPDASLDIAMKFRFACEYCLSDIIADLWRQMTDEEKCAFTDNPKFHLWQENHLMIYWICLLKEQPVPFPLLSNVDFSFMYLEHLSADENMFRLCVNEFNEIGTRYFWDRLVESRRPSNLFYSLERLIATQVDKEGYIRPDKEYKSMNAAGALVFLLQKMSEGQIDTLFANPSTGKCEIFNMLADWPNPEFVMSLLNKLCEFLEDSDYFNVIHHRAFELSNYYKSGNNIEDSLYQMIVRRLWINFPPSLKRQINDNWVTTVKFLFDAGDFDTVKLILNDEEVAQNRRRLLEEGCNYYTGFILNGQFEYLDQRLEELHVTDQERNVIRNSLNKIWIVEWLIRQNSYQTIEQFEAWVFDTDIQRADFSSQVRAHFIDSQFSTLRLFKIWFSGTNTPQQAREQCQSFLRFFLKSEQEIKDFIGKMTADSTFHRDLSAAFANLSCENVDEFLKWCCLSDSEVEILRRNMLVFRGVLVLGECVALNKYDNLNLFLQWCLDEDKAREEFIYDFLHTGVAVDAIKFAMENHTGKTAVARNFVKFVKGRWNDSPAKAENLIQRYFSTVLV